MQSPVDIDLLEKVLSRYKTHFSMRTGDAIQNAFKTFFEQFKTHVDTLQRTLDGLRSKPGHKSSADRDEIEMLSDLMTRFKPLQSRYARLMAAHIVSLTRMNHYLTTHKPGYDGHLRKYIFPTVPTTKVVRK
jgi:hypothetical protein